MHMYTYIKIWTVLDEQFLTLSENRYISVLHNVQTGRGTPPPPASYSTANRVSFPKSKATGAWNWPLNFF
jgi:hypothetical protein